jgi:branched-chain amino acid transport system ATP-binding protein
VAAVSEVSLGVRQGEVLGLIGPNGAGKTTLLNLLSGYMLPDSGRVLIDEGDFSGAAPHKLVREGVARTFQAVRLFGDLSLLENVEVAALSCHGDRTSTRASAREALKLVGLAERERISAESLPYGAQRLAAIARAIALQPRFLLLDEPAAGLNQEESRVLARIIRRLCDEHGFGILLVEHDMEVAMGISDRMHVLDSGATISEGTPEEVRRDPVVITAYLGAGHDA